MKRTWTDGAVAAELRALVDKVFWPVPFDVCLHVLSATEWTVELAETDHCTGHELGHWGCVSITGEISKISQADYCNIARSLIGQVEESIAMDAEMGELMTRGHDSQVSPL